MNLSSMIKRTSTKFRRAMADHLHRRLVRFSLPSSIVSFTFDDAPKSAFQVGGEILRSYGASGTYYISLGLLDSDTEVGRIGSVEDLVAARENGNELGCHTFDHVDAWETPRPEFMKSVAKNREALQDLLPNARFETFAYPKSGATYAIKPQLEQHFYCCRGGGQRSNTGIIDLNLVSAYFLDRRWNLDLARIRALIDQNSRSRGWLVFATHEIAANPSPFGCTAQFLDSVVDYAAGSGSLLIPVAEACRRIHLARRGP